MQEIANEESDVALRHEAFNSYLKIIFKYNQVPLYFSLEDEL